MAEDAEPAIAVSRLVVRFEGRDPIGGMRKASFGADVLDALLGAGFDVVGAESDDAEEDRSSQVVYRLGGSIEHLECLRLWRRTNCRIGIDWQLVDLRADAVVYRVSIRHAEYNLTEITPRTAGKQLVLGALERLMKRPRFGRALRSHLGVRHPESQPLGDTDVPDQLPILDPDGDRRRARAVELAERQRLRDEMTPFYVPIMNYGGIALATVGAVGVLYSWLRYDGENTVEVDYHRLLTINDVSWVLFAVGTSAYGSSLLLTPGLPDAAPAAGSTDVGLGADGSLRVRMRF